MYEIRNAQTQEIYARVMTIKEADTYCRESLGVTMRWVETSRSDPYWMSDDCLTYVSKVA